MKKRTNPILAPLLALITVATASLPARAGSENSGGTDYHPDTPAWFSSQDASRKLTACYEVSPTFIADPSKGVDSARIGKIIAQSFRKWSTYYYVTKGLKGQSYSGFDDQSKPPREIIFQLGSDPAPHCNGTEDVSFYFGVEPTEVKEAKTKLYNPFAFAAIRTAAQGVAPASMKYAKALGPEGSSKLGALALMAGAGFRF